PEESCEPSKKLKVLVSSLILFLITVLPKLSFSEEYEFDASEFEKKPYSIGGYSELRPVLFGLDKDSAFYKLRFFDREDDEATYEFNLGALIDASYQTDMVEIFVQPNILYADSYRESGLSGKMFQWYLALKPSNALSIYAGKKSVKWGKGYAWNPVGFVERMKDPNDPDLAREGLVMLTADYTKSFVGALRTLSISPVFIPVFEEVNEDFGRINNVNFAGKVYMLLYDTDIDFMFLIGDSRPNRYGFDFSRNITSNFEVHGELAFIDDFNKRLIDSDGRVHEDDSDVINYLLGFRYLSRADTTYILEYYRNGGGYSEDEMSQFFSLVESGFQNFISTGDAALLKKAGSVSQVYGGQNPMRHYLYLRISQKEPFDVLYLTPAITWIQNLSDGSATLSPEVSYKGITNTEIRLKGGILFGQRRTEYGEKQNDYRAELRVRYFF
ncbi:MAG: hypothetical protein PVJ36_08855, partial [Nitrospirota bacterium]